MTAHVCATFDPACWRCDLSSDELLMPPLNVMCPVCESPRGSRCRTTSGTNRTTDTHLARFDRSYGGAPNDASTTPDPSSSTGTKGDS